MSYTRECNGKKISINPIDGYLDNNTPRCWNGECDLIYSFSREEAEGVLKGEVSLQEIIVYGRGERQERVVLAWVGANGEFVLADEPFGKERLKKYLHGWYFSGHRMCPGGEGSLMLQEALDTFCPGWWDKIEDVLGPSSWRVNIYTEDGKIIAHSSMIDIVLGEC